MLWKKKKIKCPYCQNILEKKPSRKTSCPFCKKHIYVKSNKLVTEEEAKAIEQKWKFKHDLEKLKISEQEYNDHKAKLAKKFGFEPIFFDVAWDVLNARTLELARSQRFAELSHLYYEMARFLNEEGKDFFHVLQQSKEMELEHLKTMGIKKVEIMCGPGACPSCLKLNKKILTIEEALKTMPVPNKDCTNTLYDNFCRCLINAIARRF